MTTVEHHPAGQRFLLQGISWQAYVALRDVRENYHVRMTYDRGDLEMMSPSKRHEQAATLIDLLIHVWAEERGLDLLGCGMMTCRREDLERGLEPDKCYYVHHAAAMRAKEELDLSIDPPPELAVEVDLTRNMLDKLDLYAALGVPEVWRCDGSSLRIYRLESAGDYQPREASSTFPGFPVNEAEKVLQQAGEVSEILLVKSFREKLRANGPSPLEG